MWLEFGLKERDYDEIKAMYFLFPSIDEIIIFGSRARGDYRKTSDIDMTLKGEISRLELAKIREYLEDSRIPYIVDLVLYNDIIDEEFKKEIDRDGKKIN